MNEVVKYHNELNAVALKDWTEREMNVLFAVVAKVREKSTTEITLTFEEIRGLANYKSKRNASMAEFVDELFKVSAKLATLNYIERTSRLSGKLIVLFSTFDIDGENEILTVQVHNDFKRIFNNIGIEFTVFELTEFISISSTYAKTAYRLLKQFRTSGWWQVSLEDFRALLAIPESYKPGNIDQQILKPILAQLGGTSEKREEPIFKNLQVEKQKKKGRGRGGVLTGYKFTFDKEATGTWTEDKFDSKASDNHASKPGNSTPAKRKASKKETVPAHITDPALRTETPLTPEAQADLAKRIAGLKSSGKKGQDGE